MNNPRGGGGGAPPPPDNGGEFLLSLLQNPNRLQQQLQQQQQQQQQQHQNQQPPLTLDPAVAAVGPTLPLPHQFHRHNHQWQSNGPDLLSPNPLPPGPHHPGFPTQNPAWPSPQFNRNTQRPGFPTSNPHYKEKIGGVHKLQFGSVPETLEVLLNPNSSVNTISDSSSSREPDRRRHQQTLRPPPGFSSRPRGGGRGGNWDHGYSPRGNKDKGRYIADASNGTVLARSGAGLAEQLDRPGPPRWTQLHSVSVSDVEDSLMRLELEGRVDEEEKVGDSELDDVGEELPDGLLVGGDSEGMLDKKQKRFRDKDFRSDKRGQRMLTQRMRMSRCQMRCRVDIERFNAPFLSIYESLIPLEEEKAKQKQLLALLQKLVNKEWPEARLYLYGSCANSFGVLKSDIDVCLAIDEDNINKSEILLKLADMLQSDNLQNVQALTRARVPIVKLKDPVTGISCDICINNVLAVINTKLLRDYAGIDVRLRQLAFIVKHWAKSRCVNETYQGTLSSYAYVLMCIHFLQLRRPPILPCLQGIETTYSATVDGVECSFFDQVEKIRDFGSRNGETIAHLVWGFFNYWAYRHDYANDVISVRAGSIISKREKDWTRRIGNDRHLICIEDPFETSHDLGRVVDKYSIRVLREEFERAAEIMQYDPNPCVTLFERYIPS